MSAHRLLFVPLLGLAAVLPLPAADDDTAAAIAAFATVNEVLQHPRCANCHIPGDAPLQFDTRVAHQMNVRRGPEGKGATGLPCATCHGEANSPASYGAHAPPGAPHWSLPPPEHKMAWIDRPAAEVCANLKDPAQNGGKDFAALLDHVAHDKLVLWGWAPGGDRVPVNVPHDRFVAAFKTWLDAGAPCPAGA
jgi:hypothetical protein